MFRSCMGSVERYSLLDGSVSYSGNCFLDVFLAFLKWHFRHLCMHFVQERG